MKKRRKFQVLSTLLAAVLSAAVLIPAAAAGQDYRGKTVILYTGNVRGEVDVYPQIAHIRSEYEAKGADVILADAGNYLRGVSCANATRGEAVYTLMDAAGYDVAGMGLAEFSYTDATTGYLYHSNYTRYHTQAMLQDGCEETTYNVNKDGAKTAVLPAKAPAKFQTVCSNVAPNEVYSFRGSAVVTAKGGLKVRFLALADPGITGQVQDGYVTVREVAAGEGGADVTVTLSNVPGAQNAGTTIAAAPGGGVIAGALVIDNAARTVTREDVTLRKEGESVDLSRVDRDVYALAENLKQSGHSYFTSQVLLNGSDKASRNGETNLGDLVTDALVWYGENHIEGVDRRLPFVAIQNGGNCDDFLYPGQATDADLLRALPFSPMGIGVLQVTGAQLLETLEAATQSADCPGFAQVSGLTYTLDMTEDYDAGAAYGKYFVADSINRVTITSVNGRSFDPAATYNLVCDNFLINGNDTYYTLKNARDAGAKYVNNGPDVKVRDAVALYVINASGGYVTERYAAPQGRITVQRFADVRPGDYFYQPVNWAVDAGVTSGVTPTAFGPRNTCTRAQALTFLWRAAGSPAPRAGAVSLFSSLPRGSEYAETALRWASGEWGKLLPLAGALGLDPAQTVTRAETVAALWLWRGCPAANSDQDFSDVSRNAWYAEAVRWSASEGITGGTAPGRFSPDAPCTRAQVMTFLYKGAAG